MSGIREVTPVKPVCAVTMGEGIDIPDVFKDLEDIIGRVEERSEVFAFDFTDYYREEMGKELRKVFLSHEELIHPDRLPGIKLRTQAVEEAWAVEGRRRVNLDPGYVTLAKLVLASTKDFAHRIYLGDGIYGDVQLRYQDNAFQPQPWTFPDYRTAAALAFFENVRAALFGELRRHE